MEELVFDTLQIYFQDMFNLTLPAWTRSVYPERMKNLAEMYFEFAFGTDALKRLTYGTLKNAFFNWKISLVIFGAKVAKEVFLCDEK